MSLVWEIAIIVVCIVLFAFASVVIVGAPYLPTLKKQVPQALDLVDLKAGQTLLELGSGDGRILFAAAERGIYAVGYELNLLLVIYSRLKTYKHRSKVKIIWGNYWHRKWPEVDGVFVFLLQPYMEKLDKKLVQEYGFKGKLVSFAFTIPNRKPFR